MPFVNVLEAKQAVWSKPSCLQDCLPLIKTRTLSSTFCLLTQSLTQSLTQPLHTPLLSHCLLHPTAFRPVAAWRPCTLGSAPLPLDTLPLRMPPSTGRSCLTPGARFDSAFRIVLLLDNREQMGGTGQGRMQAGGRTGESGCVCGCA